MQYFAFSLRVTALVAVLFLSACGGGGSGTTSADLIDCESAVGGTVGQAVQLGCRAVGASPDSVSWTATDPAGAAVDLVANGLQASFTPQKAGKYRVRVTGVVGGDSETENIEVTVGFPTLAVDCPASVSSPAQRVVLVDCSVAGAEGRSPTYRWTLTPPPGVAVSLVDANVEDARFTPPTIGAYALVLEVSAADGEKATASVQVNVTSATPWKIVAIGDSITQSNLLHQSYRYKLWTKLVDSGVAFDLVGTQNANSNECITDEGAFTCTNNHLPAGTQQVAQPDYKGLPFDPDHEGYWGRTAGEALTLLQSSLVTLKGQGAAPDIALVHLGTNDLYLGSGTTQQKTAAAIDGLEGVIDELRAVNPQVTIVIAQIIPFSGDSGEVPTLNSLIAALEQSKAKAGSPIIVVDQYTGFSVTADTFDGIHPNDSGEQKIANRFYGAIEPIIQ